MTAPRTTPRRHGLRTVYDRTYPPNTTDFTPIVRAIQAANPDVVTVCSYPLNSVGIVRAVSELNYKPKMIGGAMVGLQATAIKRQLGPLLNGWVNYETWVPAKSMMFAGHRGLPQEVPGPRRRRRRRSARLLSRHLGLRLYPDPRRGGAGTKSLNDNTLADYIGKTTFKTIMGDVKFGKGGEWAEGRMLQVQYHGIKSTELDQFRGMDTQTVLTPSQYKTGDVVYPFEKAK